jgi:UDP-N-acetylmuramoylalanine--D-glutamate ligase
MNLSNLIDKKVAVLGFGRSGVAVAKRLVSLGARVFVSEQEEERAFDPNAVLEIKKLGVETEFGGHTPRSLEGTDLLVLSPGVHSDIPLLSDAAKRRIPAVSEVELAYSILTKPIIAVTGTNGKTTTSVLIGEMLKRGGRRAAVAGNIGYPLSAVDDSELDYIVAEISSYQLEGIRDFKPLVSVILNITEDHLERHKNMLEYIKLKARIFMNQGEGDFFVYNADDASVSDLTKSSNAEVVPFSKSRKLKSGVFVDSGYLQYHLSGNAGKIIDREKISLMGEHNLENALAASAAATLLGIEGRTIARVLSDFKGVQHRLEHVAEISGISFYNDSKATNPNSTVFALRALDKNIILIAGGRDKGGDLSKLVDESKGRIKALILIGEARERMKKSFIRLRLDGVGEAASMEDAVRKAYALSSQGDKVLLSPACASFDMFRDFEERGDVFKAAVNSLRRRAGK